MKVTMVPALFASLLVGGCASSTLSKDECRTVHWRTIGYEDGVAGRSGEQIGRHRQACAEHGVTPDLDAHRAGRAEGLREFCQPRNGYRAGASGQPYYDSCPSELAPAFLAAYDEGRELYVRERRVADADAAITPRRYEIARLEDSLVRRGFRVADEAATPEPLLADAHRLEFRQPQGNRDSVEALEEARRRLILSSWFQRCPVPPT